MFHRLVGSSVVFVALVTSATALAADDKVTVCHSTGSATNPTVIITISASAFAAHEANHGDFKAFTDAAGSPTCAAPKCEYFAVLDSSQQETDVWDVQGQTFVARDSKALEGSGQVTIEELTKDGASQIGTYDMQMKGETYIFDPRTAWDGGRTMTSATLTDSSNLKVTYQANDEGPNATVATVELFTSTGRPACVSTLDDLHFRHR